MRSGSGTSVRRAVNLIAGVTVALSLADCGSADLLPQDSKNTSSNFQSYEQVQTAYSKIVPGSTRLADLPKLGFDTTAMANVEMLSNADVNARIMPSNPRAFDLLPKPARACIEAQERCSALVFHLEFTQSQRNGSVFLDAAGLRRETLSTGWSAQVVLLMQDGQVVYKLMSGRPHIVETKDSRQPLGPLQDLGENVVHALQ